jgi:quinol monooxygenase YgiN
LIVFSMEIVAPDPVRTALLRTLGSILEPTRVAPGCLSARLFSDLDKRKALLLVEDVDTVEREEGVDTLALHRSVAGGAIR